MVVVLIAPLALLAFATTNLMQPTRYTHPQRLRDGCYLLVKVYSTTKRSSYVYEQFLIRNETYNGCLIVNQAGEIYETRNDLYLLLAGKF